VANTESAPSRALSNIPLRVALYYAVLLAAATLLWRLPYGQKMLRGSLGALAGGDFAGVGKRGAADVLGSEHIDDVTLALNVSGAMLGAILLTLPVAWIFTLTRQKRGYQQSVVQTLMILPPLVAGVVVMVKYSLTLAFGLAGIVAAVRFRNTLDDSKDAVYVFLATAVGLASAVQLSAALVISAMFNLIVLALWYTDFGRSAAFEGSLAERRMEQARARMRQTGSFVALLDSEIFEKMTPEQLELAADRAWRRRRRLETDQADTDEAQRSNVLLRIRTYDPDGSRVAAEATFEDFLKKWRFGGVVHEKDGTHVVEYAVQLKKTARSEELLDALNAKSQLIGVEIK